MIRAWGWSLAGACLLWAGLCAPAKGHLGQSILDFDRSSLLNDAGFRFEGRVGARYRFGPARFARFGNGLLALDVAEGIVVQELLLLPLPITREMERQQKRLRAQYLAQGGFPSAHLPKAEAAIQAAMDRGTAQEASLGPRHRILVRLDLALKSYLVALQVNGPAGMAPPTGDQEHPDPGASQP
jgi:hypothetical protein